MSAHFVMRREALIVQPELAAVVALGLQLVDEKFRERGTSLSDDARALMHDAVAIARAAAERAASDPLPIVDAPASDVREWQTSEAVRRVLGLRSTRRVLQLIEKGELMGVMVKGQWKVQPESVQRLLDQRGAA